SSLYRIKEKKSIVFVEIVPPERGEFRTNYAVVFHAELFRLLTSKKEKKRGVSPSFSKKIKI
ncbi:MAG: hypothetical protein IJZ52_03350, partial [Clostridium sp.]|nr:hypothetical protein [Clostridium sp.]